MADYRTIGKDQLSLDREIWELCSWSCPISGLHIAKGASSPVFFAVAGLKFLEACDGGLSQKQRARTPGLYFDRWSDREPRTVNESSATSDKGTKAL